MSFYLFVESSLLSPLCAIFTRYLAQVDVDVVARSPAAQLLANEYGRISGDNQCYKWSRVKTWKAFDETPMETWATFVTPGMTLQGFSQRMIGYVRAELRAETHDEPRKVFENQLFQYVSPLKT